jgi:hypothetical protein
LFSDPTSASLSLCMAATNESLERASAAEFL